MEEKIKIKEKYLIFRTQAKSLANLILKKLTYSKDVKIAFDFQNVKFISRSFADEFLNILSRLSIKKKQFSFLNLNPAVLKMINLVKKQRQKIKK